MKKSILFSLFLAIFCCFSSKSQIYVYNQYPVLTTTHGCQNNVDLLFNNAVKSNTNLRIGYSLRLLRSDYTGPLIRLRCVNSSNVNIEKDFKANSSTAMLDKQEIMAWRDSNCGSAAPLHVVKWFNQVDTSAQSLVIDATQSNTNLQAIFDVINFQILPDGNNDFLDTGTKFLDHLSQNGADATVLLVTKATNKTQYNFGVFNGQSDRWSAHINFKNNNINHTMFADLGGCCINGRDFVNKDNENNFAQYTFMRSTPSTTSTVIARINTTSVINYAISTNSSFTGDQSLTIFKANGYNAGETSNAPMKEFILFNDDIPDNIRKYMEDNQIKFWCL